MHPLGLTDDALAEAIGVPTSRIEALSRERSSVSADTALRLGRYFGTTAEFWLNMQTGFDLKTALLSIETDLRKIAPRDDRAVL